MPVEKNDVDIERLFSWSKETIITGLKGKDIKVYLRLLGDADLNRARVMALRRSAEFRKALKDPDSNERIAFIPYKEELSKDILVESIVALSLRDLTQQSLREVVVKPPKDPDSDASTEELEQFQKEVDEWPKKRESIVREKIDVLANKRREELRTQTEDILYDTYLSQLIKELCEQELSKRFKEYCLFFGTYADKKFTQRFFESFDTFDNLPTEVKDRLIMEYSFLEVESEDLKK